MSEDYRSVINSDTVDNLLSLAIDNYAVDCFEGVLLDNYIIYNAETIKIGNIKPRKFIILREKYMNEWSSATEMIMTDNYDVVDEFIKRLEMEEEEIEREYKTMVCQ